MKASENQYITSLISRMTLDQKVGALLTLGFAGTIARPHIYEFIEKYHCGGLRLSCDMRSFGSYVDPNSAKTVVSVEAKTGIRYKGAAPLGTASEYKQVLDQLQKRARRRPLSLPLHFSYDQEGGTSADFCFGGVHFFPKPMGIRATDDPNNAYEAALAVSKQSKAVGFNWIHSPVLDVNTDPRNPEIYTRAYSDRAEEVALYAEASLKGFQEGRMIATGKHFPGRGHSDIDAHFQVPVIDVGETTMMERELLPYRRLIAAGLLPSIMIAHSIFPAFDPDHIATVSKKILTGLLRERLGFDGVITTDSMTMGAIATRYGVANACGLALEAGADLVLMKAENELVGQTVAVIKEFVASGRIPIAELDRKVYRVLALKYRYGLFFDHQDQEVIPETVLNDPAIVRLEQKIARESVLVARDRNGLIPVNRAKKVLVIEQKVKHYNDFKWHSGILYEQCLAYSGSVQYQETAFTYDEQDKQQIRERIREADLIIVTNYFIRGNLCNRDFIETEIIPSGKEVIVVTNTPYQEISIPPSAETVVVTFATSPEHIRVTAGTLFGEITPAGVWPLKQTLD